MVSYEIAMGFCFLVVLMVSGSMNLTNIVLGQGVGYFSDMGLIPENNRRLMCLSMFWHFLDVVWIGVFTFVYLMGVLPPQHLFGLCDGVCVVRHPHGHSLLAGAGQGDCGPQHGCAGAGRLRRDPDPGAHGVLPAHERQDRRRLDAAVHHLHRGVRGHRHRGDLVGDVPHERQHDAKHGRAPDAQHAMMSAPSGPAEQSAATGTPRLRSAGLRYTLVACAALVIAVLLALGTWQVQRLQWKLALIERVNARVHAEPVPAPGPQDWAKVS
eukprot:gene19617-27781_t